MFSNLQEKQTIFLHQQPSNILKKKHQQKFSWGYPLHQKYQTGAIKNKEKSPWTGLHYFTDHREDETEN
jgi:hypothetical protein